MRLVFIHGWGFDPAFWDAVGDRLADFAQARVDLGFFGAPADYDDDGEPAVMIGHSLGFLHGIGLKQDWAGWVAINGFTRFVKDGAAGCVPARMLREMRQRFVADHAATLTQFYGLLGAAAGRRPAQSARLLAGLDQLRDADISERLARLTIPGLALAGRHDPLVPVSASEALGDYASDGIAWSEGGHLLPLSEPDLCAERLTAFLRSLAS